MSRSQLTNTAIAFSVLAFSSSTFAKSPAVNESKDVPQTPVASLLGLSSGGAISINNRPLMVGSDVVSVLLDDDSSRAMLTKASVANPEAGFLGKATKLSFSLDFVDASGKTVTSKLPMFLTTQVNATSQSVLLKTVNSAISSKSFFHSGKFAIVQYQADLDPDLLPEYRGKGKEIIAIIATNSGAVSYKGLYSQGTDLSVSPLSDMAVVSTPLAGENPNSTSTNIQILTPQGISKQKEVSGFGTPYGWTKEGQVSISGGTSARERGWYLFNPSSFDIRKSITEPTTFVFEPKPTLLTVNEDGRLAEANVKSGVGFLLSGEPGKLSFILQATPDGRGGVLTVNPDGTAMFSKTSPVSAAELTAYNKREAEFNAAFTKAKDVSDALVKLTNGDPENLPNPSDLKAKLSAMGLSDEMLSGFEVNNYSLPISDPSAGILRITAGGREIIVNADGSRRIRTL